MCVCACIRKPENDPERIFLNEYNQKIQWKIVPRYNVSQALKTVFGDMQIPEEGEGEGEGEAKQGMEEKRGAVVPVVSSPQ
jgi:hypothetical protein